MKIRAIAWQTFGGFLRNRLIMVFLALFACVVLLMMTPLLGYKAVTTAENAAQMQAFVLGEVGVIMGMLSGFGTLLAAWATADALVSEMKSGTVLAVMARPVWRWQFLAGKYLGVQLLLVTYVFSMFGMSYLLAWMGGERILSSPWVLIVYPLVRYSIYSAIAMLLASFLHPLVTMGIVLVMAALAEMASPGADSMPSWLQMPLWIVLPSINLLSESRFFAITKAALKPIGWTQHLTTLAYGLDYALVCFLLAAWSFHHRSLSRD